MICALLVCVCLYFIGHELSYVLLCRVLMFVCLCFVLCLQMCVCCVFVICFVLFVVEWF